MTAKKATKKPFALTVLLLPPALLLAAGYYIFAPGHLPWTRQETQPGRLIESPAEIQIALARRGFSPGSIDGTIGSQTRLALAAYQGSRGLSVTGQWDEPTKERLRIKDPTQAYVELTESALARITPQPKSWRERGQLEYFGYHTTLEMVAEKTTSDPDYIRALNPDVDWSRLRAGDRLLAPLVPPFRITAPISMIRIALAKRQLQAFGSEGEILFHCPVSIARNVAKRPVGELKVKVRADQPNYTFNPNILQAAAEREGLREKFIIQPGPNNPVGTVWLGLDRPSYGIHGTPVPEKVGRTESNGCFRLANWNAETLLHGVTVGTPVRVLP